MPSSPPTSATKLTTGGGGAFSPMSLAVHSPPVLNSNNNRSMESSSSNNNNIRLSGTSSNTTNTNNNNLFINNNSMSSASSSSPSSPVGGQTTPLGLIGGGASVGGNNGSHPAVAMPFLGSTSVVVSSSKYASSNGGGTGGGGGSSSSSSSSSTSSFHHHPSIAFGATGGGGVQPAASSNINVDGATTMNQSNHHHHSHQHHHHQQQQQQTPQQQQQRKKQSTRDPLSHRMIEKRRRDRMNNCLTDLSHLIPNSFIKKQSSSLQNRGRIEKTEIIEMAIKYLKHLQDICRPFLADDGPLGPSPPVSSVPIQQKFEQNDHLFSYCSTQSSHMAAELIKDRFEYYRIGFRDCLNDSKRLFIEAGLDGIYGKIFDHIQDKFDNLNIGIISKCMTGNSGSNNCDDEMDLLRMAAVKTPENDTKSKTGTEFFGTFDIGGGGVGGAGISPSPPSPSVSATIGNGPTPISNLQYLMAADGTANNQTPIELRTKNDEQQPPAPPPPPPPVRTIISSSHDNGNNGNNENKTENYHHFKKEIKERFRKSDGSSDEPISIPIIELPVVINKNNNNGISNNEKINGLMSTTSPSSTSPPPSSSSKIPDDSAIVASALSKLLSTFENGSSNTPNYVPVFALHPTGHYYVPMQIESSILGFDDLTKSIITNNKSIRQTEQNGIERDTVITNSQDHSPTKKFRSYESTDLISTKLQIIESNDQLTDVKPLLYPINITVNITFNRAVSMATLFGSIREFFVQQQQQQLSLVHSKKKLTNGYTPDERLPPIGIQIKQEPTDQSSISTPVSLSAAKKRRDSPVHNHHHHTQIGIGNHRSLYPFPPPPPVSNNDSGSGSTPETLPPFLVGANHHPHHLSPYYPSLWTPHAPPPGLAGSSGYPSAVIRSPPTSPFNHCWPPSSKNQPQQQSSVPINLTKEIRLPETATTTTTSSRGSSSTT